jgi:GT2 family glycosyltransferase
LVSVIIPTRDRRASVLRALAALARQSASADSFEVVVAVDGSTDGTWEVLADRSVPYALHRVKGLACGRATARNLAIAMAHGDILVMLDDDMEPAHGFIDRHRTHHPSGSRNCVLGAVPVELDERASRAAAYIQRKFADHLANLGQPGHRFTPRDFYSGNVSIRADVLTEVGGFDESFSLYGNEDVELYLRLRSLGVTMRYDPDALAYQSYEKSFDELALDTVAKGRTTVQLARRHADAFGSLRIASPRDGTRAWTVARAGLLDLARRRPAADRATLAVAARLERLGLWRHPIFYRAVLDYAFWVGVDAALADCIDGDDLRQLREEIRRGPIDLLLHG